MTHSIIFSDICDSYPQLSSLARMCENESLDCWLVGGSVRDLLLGRIPTDIDICSVQDPTRLARSWARQIGGRWFWLDEQRRQSRVLTPDSLLTDFCPLRAPSLIEDLALRDFTINAIALPFSRNSSAAELIDPLDGRNDLMLGQLRHCSERSFSDDPLRLLKGIRHAVDLKFALNAATLSLMASQSGLIRKVAGERIRDELCRILEADADTGLSLMQESGLLVALFDGIDINLPHKDELNRLDRLLRDLEKSSDLPLQQRGTFLLAELLRQAGISALRPLLHDRLRLSRQHQRLVELLQAKIPEQVIKQMTGALNMRRQALLYELYQPCAFERLVRWGLFPEALPLARIQELRRSFTAEEQGGKVPDLLNGQTLGTMLGHEKIAQIGPLLKAVKRAEIEGEISTRKDAENWIKQQIAIDR